MAGWNDDEFRPHNPERDSELVRLETLLREAERSAHRNPARVHALEDAIDEYYRRKYVKIVNLTPHACTVVGTDGNVIASCRRAGLRHQVVRGDALMPREFVLRPCGTCPYQQGCRSHSRVMHYPNCQASEMARLFPK